eukprot:1158665-Pyramimonas_sp.AAC.1
MNSEPERESGSDQVELVGGDAGLNELIHAFSGVQFEPEPPPRKRAFVPQPIRDTWLDARPPNRSFRLERVALTRSHMAGEGALFIAKVDNPTERIWPHPSIRLRGSPKSHDPAVAAKWNAARGVTWDRLLNVLPEQSVLQNFTYNTCDPDFHQQVLEEYRDSLQTTVTNMQGAYAAQDP